MSTRKIFKATNIIADNIQPVAVMGLFASGWSHSVGPMATRAKNADIATAGFGSFLSWLPGWSIFHGVISIINGINLLVNDRYYEVPESAKIRKLKGYLQVLSGVGVTGGGIGVKVVHAANPANTTALPVLFLTLAVNAFVEFVIAYDDYFKIKKVKNLNSTKDCMDRSAALVNIIAKGCAFAGWASLAFSLGVYGSTCLIGLEVGMMCLLASALVASLNSVFNIVSLVCGNFYINKSAAIPYSQDKALTGKSFTMANTN